MLVPQIVKKNWQLILILLVSLILRVWRSDALITIGGDQGQDLEIIHQISGGNLTLLGPKIAHIQGSSFYLGPAYYYLQLPFVLFTGFDPIGTVVPIIISRILTIIFIYIITLRIFGKYEALFASIIAALSPYWVDKLGYPSYPYLVLPIASSIILIVIFSNFENKKNTKAKSLSLFVLGILSGLFTHLHYLALSIFLPALIFSFPKISIRRKVLLSLSGFFIAILPQIIFEIRNNFFLTQQLRNLLSIGLFSQNNSQIWVNLGQIIHSIIYYSTGFKFPAVVSLIIIITASFVVFTKIDKKYKYIIYFFLITVIINLIGALVYFGRTQPHYLAAIYPILFIVTGSVIAQTKKIHKLLPILLISIVAMFHFKANDFLSPNGHTMPEDLTLKEIRTISEIISKDVNGQSFNVTSTLDGDSRAMPYRYLIKTFGKNPEGIENFNKIQNLYIITRDPARSIRENQLFEISSFQPSNFEETWDIKGSIKLHKLTKNSVIAEEPKNFVVIVNPIRPRQLWFDQDIKSLTSQTEIIKKNNLPSSWLIAYDNLFDTEIINVLKSLNQNQEVGAFLEVSEKLATDSKVSYKVADGDYYRPDKVFLSGYSKQERSRIIKTYFKQYEETFGKKPLVTGAWYIDSSSLNELASLGVKSSIVVSDQFDTDAARVWGQYFAFPYYPSKYNSLEPAKVQNSKIPIVQLQWAQRDPVLSYGKRVEDSRQSFQANDYINNGFSSDYFKNLIDVYLKNKKTPFNQITIGLEAGQEGVRFKDEFENQIKMISDLQSQNKITAILPSEFANWYQKTYPGISPSHFLEKKESFWYMSPYLRVAIFKEGENYYLKDLRYYNNTPSKDYFYKDQNTYLDRKINAVIDQLEYGNQIKLSVSKITGIKESFDQLTIYGDNKEIKITRAGIYDDNQQIVSVPISTTENKERIILFEVINSLKNAVIRPLSVIKYSKINNNMLIGFSVSDERILALNGTKVGLYKFNFQTLSKFKSPYQLIEKWQPWIN